MKLSRQFDATN